MLRILTSFILCLIPIRVAASVLWLLLLVLLAAEELVEIELCGSWKDEQEDGIEKRREDQLHLEIGCVGCMLLWDKRIVLNMVDILQAVSTFAP